MTNVTNLKPHPYADLFPYIEGGARTEFVEDIRLNGLQEQIILLDGMILDGRNRYKALQELGELRRSHFIEFSLYCKMAQIAPDPLQFVLSRNLHRRHLNASQLAMVGSNLATLGQGQHKDANLHLSAMRMAEAAEMLSVSERTIKSAKKVRQQGAAEVVSAVEQGALSVSAAEALARLPKEEQAALIRQTAPEAVKKVIKDLRNETTAQKKQKRAEKEKALGAKLVALPEKQYGVILADPEWKFEPYSRETGMDRAADNHYPTSSLEEIMARPVGQIAAKDSVLFMWATRANFPDALRVVEAWGFKFCTFGVWHKNRIGNGYWLRDNGEPFIIAKKGDLPAPAMGEQANAVFNAPTGKHSQKPTELYELIERYFPSLPKIELNARVRRQGWDAWGNEVPDAEPEPQNLPAKPVTMDKLAAAQALLGADDSPQNAIYRSLDKGAQNVRDLLGFGDLVEVNKSGQKTEYRVLMVNGPYQTKCGAQYYSLALKEPKKFNATPKKAQKASSFLSEIVAINGELLPLNLEADLSIKKLGGAA